MSGLPPTPPRVRAEVVAELTEKAPNRVRKKLDRSPEQARDWNWQLDNDRWRVDTDGEEVQLRVDDGAILSTEAVTCSCLLSPRCFHVLACLTLLPIADETEFAPTTDEEAGNAPKPDAPSGDTPSQAANDSETGGEVAAAVRTEEPQRAAARQTFDAAAALLASGARAAGTLQQAALLRAAHQSRLAGLHRLGNAAIRLVSSLRQCRTGADTFESDALLLDLRELLCCSSMLQRDEEIGAGWFGVGRRRYATRAFLKVHGLFCEPLATRSGYAGVVSYFLDEDGVVYSVANVRPGDEERILSSYRGGLEAGGITASHRDASRGVLLMQHGSTSDDGRIGGGQKAKGVLQSARGWSEEAVLRRFQEPLDSQIARVFAQSQLSDEERRAGWDLLFLRGSILGGDGATLALALEDETTLCLTCASFSDKLAFADNFKRLGERQTNSLCIARLIPDELGRAQLLAIAADNRPRSDRPSPSVNPSARESERGSEQTTSEAWNLPEAWNGRVNVGLDALQGAHLPNRPAPAIGGWASSYDDDGMDPLRRRMRAIALGGRHGRAGDREAARDAARLLGNLLPTAACLLDGLVLACSPSDVDHLGTRFPTDPQPLARAYLAAAVYEQAARSRYLESRWLQVVEA